MRWSILAAVLVTLVWLSVIAWWRITQRVVVISDLVLYMVALPLAVVATSLFIFRTISRKSRTSSSSAALPSADPAEPATAGSRLPILAAWALTSLATSSEELLQSLAERKLRPIPDISLRDEDGFPLFSARVPSLDIGAIETTLAVEHNARTGFARLPDNCSVAFARAMALLSSLLDQALNDWPLHDIDTNSFDSAAAMAMLRGASGKADAAEKSYDMRVKLILSASLQAHEKEFARSYIEYRLTPLQLRRATFQFDLIAAGDEATALELANTFECEATGSQGQVLLLLACDSMLCQTVVQDWQTSERLFDSRRPNGLMMGEAAFGILCAGQAAQEYALPEPICHLARMSRAQRDESADAPGKPSCSCLKKQVENALKASGCIGDAIGTVVCDADHRSGRTLECIGAMIEHTPQLDAIQNRLAIGESCGHLGAATATGLIAIAALQAKAACHPVLLFNVGHPTDRAAAVLIPLETISTTAHSENLHAA